MTIGLYFVTHFNKQKYYQILSDFVLNMFYTSIKAKNGSKHESYPQFSRLSWLCVLRTVPVEECCMRIGHPFVLETEIREIRNHV